MKLTIGILMLLTASFIHGFFIDAKVVAAGGFDVIGISIRTSNKVELAAGGRIPKLWSDFYGANVLSRIPNKVDNNIIVLYSDYASDKDGEYTYTIGAKVSSTTVIPEGMSVRPVPAGKYAVFTSDRGPVAEVVQKAWKQIWAQPRSQPGGDRSYKVDYEIYDERSRDPNNSQMEVFVGIK